MASTLTKCPECNTPVNSGEDFCSHCGHIFNSSMNMGSGTGQEEDRTERTFSSSVDAIQAKRQERSSVARIIAVLAVVALAVVFFVSQAGDYIPKLESAVPTGESQSLAPDALADDASSSFWGVWIGAFREEGNAYTRADEAVAAGLDASVFISNEWTNLNQDMYYVVTAGCYETEESAQEALRAAIDAGFSDAYIRNSGERK